MLQSCGSGNIDPEEENGLMDVNPVVEEGEPDNDDEIEGGLDYDINEGNDAEFE